MYLHKDFPGRTNQKRLSVVNQFQYSRPNGFRVDEYPYASSVEGGFYDGRLASTFYTPIGEHTTQSIQVKRQDFLLIMEQSTTQIYNTLVMIMDMMIKGIM